MTDKLTKSAVEHLSQELGEPGWLAERRLVAFDLFEKLELPDPKGEEWRYVDVRRFDFDRFSAPIARRSAPGLPADLAAKGVVVTDFVTAAEKHPDLLKEHFFTEVPTDEHKFTALHAAFHSDGIIVYVPKGVEVELPFEALRRVEPGGSVFPHTTIVVDEMASVTFVDRFSSDDGDEAALCASVVDVEAS